MRPRQTKHGTCAMYAFGCRCTPCSEQQRQRVARNRADRLASGRLTHGTRSAYDAGCRCDPCRQARRETYVRLEAKWMP
jgi:hypothetical protein